MLKCGKQCKIWRKHHPNKVVTLQVINLFNDSAMSHFREIHKRKQKQAPLDRFLVKVARKENDSMEPIDCSDSISDHESRPT